VLGGLALLQLSGLASFMPRGYAVTGWTAFGGVLLGLGAAVNQACVFGAIARFGNGEWAYVFTPFGYFCGAWLGSIGLPRLLPAAMPQPLPGPAWVLRPDAAWVLVALAVGIGAWMLWRVLQPVWMNRAAPAKAPRLWQRWQAHVWRPHEATLVIGLAFVLLLGLGQRWTYIELLSDWAHGRWDDTARRLMLFVALGAGAVWGGLTANRFSAQPWRAGRIARCALGGALMGVGAELVPGANDGLLLLGLPLLWPHAWLAVTTMALSIVAWLGLRRLGTAAAAR
jgi:toxin CptA